MAGSLYGKRQEIVKPVEKTGTISDKLEVNQYTTLGVVTSVCTEDQTVVLYYDHWKTGYMRYTFETIDKMYQAGKFDIIPAYNAAPYGGMQNMVAKVPLRAVAEVPLPIVHSDFFAAASREHKRLIPDKLLPTMVEQIMPDCGEVDAAVAAVAVQFEAAMEKRFQWFQQQVVDAVAKIINERLEQLTRTPAATELQSAQARIASQIQTVARPSLTAEQVYQAIADAPATPFSDNDLPKPDYEVERKD